MIQFLLISLIMTFSGNPDSKTIFDFELQDVRGNSVDMADFKGNVMLIVNTASKCGFTRQYSGLQSLHEKYKDEGLVVIGFPTADFANQEFDSDEEISEFCEVNFGVTFPLVSRLSVRGSEQHELFNLLTSKENADFTGDIRWNFEKFLIDQEGNLVRRFRSDVEPDSEEMMSSIEALLGR